MSKGKIDKKKILEMVKNEVITPEQALKLIREAASQEESEEEPVKVKLELKGQEKERSKLALKSRDNAKAITKNTCDNDEVAVIGVSGRFPGASNIEEFWSNLSRGVDSVTEIPTDRWDGEFYHTDINEPNKTYCKFGGMLSDIDKFDPLFFNISPLEAELMDPQHRIFLQEAWKALEHAGYGEDELSGTKCSVFVGVAQGDYLLNIKSSDNNLNTQVLTGYSNNMLAARISYYLNLTGLNMPIDTACSSSLIAIHEACRNIISGESEMAVAGGVCVLSTPEMHIMASKGGMLSKQGKCKTFDNDADGFVPGEAVGVVVLKKLSKALSDRDTIYGIIKGSAANYDGKTNGITAPSTVSQAKLQTEVYEKFGIAPETISYIETHGTGTKLGDPIEINALKTSFAQFTDKKNFCALASVKTNIGHSMTAAGVVGLIKILLCMKYKKMVPLLHFKELNEHIKLQDSPFYINTDLKEWEKQSGTPRLAAISSFGLSGTNCHMVIQEAPEEENSECDAMLPYYFIPFSAKTKEALFHKLNDMLEWLSGEGRQQKLSDISYTLSKGRNHFNVRAVAVVEDKKHLKQVLEKVIEGDNPLEYMSGEFEPGTDIDPSMEELAKEMLTKLSDGQLKNEGIKNLLLTLSEMYLKGITPDFRLMFSRMKIKRIGLPTYPFASERYWIPYKAGASGNPEGRMYAKKLHPLIGENISTLKEQRYVSSFSGNEFFFTDHVVNGKKVLPGVAYIEMARAAAELATGQKTIIISDMLWLQPFIAGENEIEASILLVPGDDYVSFEVLSENNNKLHAAGRIETKNPDGYEKIDIDDVKSRLKSFIGSDICYKIHSGRGIEYQENFRAVKELYTNGQEALSLLDLSYIAEGYMLHPGLMDGALQTVAGLDVFSGASEGKSFLPFSAEGIEIFRQVTSKCYAHAVVKGFENGGFKFDINIYDTNGSVLVKIKNIVSRPVEQMTDLGNKREITEIIDLREVWKEKKAEYRDATSEGNGAILVFCLNKDVYEIVTAKINSQFKKPRNIFCIRPGENFFADENSLIIINPSKEEDYSRMMSRVIQKSGYITDVIHLWSEVNADCNRDIEEQIEMGVNSLLYFTKALVKSHAEEDINMLYVYLNKEDTRSPLNFAVGAFAKSVRLEKPNIKMKSVRIDMTVEENNSYDPAFIADTVLMEFGASSDGETRVSYHKAVRSVTALEEVELKADDSMPILKDKGVYIITGGAGGLGIIFTNYIARSVKATIILLGRSELDAAKNDAISEIADSTFSEIRYIRCDISQKNEIESVIANIKTEFGRIDGVIHSAGLIQDSFIFKKTTNNMNSVFRPKIQGLINIDQSLLVEKLDFFVIFSAIASVFGNAGQSDYAYANSFLDEYSRYRADLVAKKMRHGKTVSINWPLWDDGGMKIDKHQEDMLFERLGMTRLNTSKGIKAFEEILACREPQISVVEGVAEKIRNCFAVKGAEFRISVNNSAFNSCLLDEDEENIIKMTEAFLKETFAKVVKMTPDKIKVEISFERYGIDSIIIIGINNELEKHFGKLSKTLLFEYRNLKELTQYFVKNQKEKLYQKFGIGSEGKREIVKSEDSSYINLELRRNREVYGTRFLKDVNCNAGNLHGKTEDQNSDDIAIVGVSGRYPMADNLEEFWKNMLDSKDCISEIPKERWDNEKYYSQDRNASGKTYSKWGGFINDADKFDPFFFNISPREAEIMDPQERIFLETAYKSVEDAGYRRSDLEGKSVGVFVGVMYGNYQLVAMDEYNKNGLAPVNTSFSSIANRVSYFFNLCGPSIALDTMCSSSLTALHIACDSIKRGESESAIVGGVNLSLHVMKYLVLSQGKFVSTDGKCRSFGAEGDGYVPGEGVGAVYIKPLKNAIKDGDSIYAVIKATAINHGGRTNGFTVPNPNAQSALIIEAIKKSGMNPRTISCIEAHGTGTALGDPIEITGLKKAFEEFTTDKQFCSIGSIKSNIGHLESAAGIAGLTKVLLQIKYKTLVASIHSKNLNSNIDFEGSPVYVQQETAEWKKPIIKEGGSYKEYPRRAAISAFGAGGSNSHVIIEEYEASVKSETESYQEPYIFVLSAKSDERLKAYAQEIICYLDRECKSSSKVESDSLCARVDNDIKDIIAEVLDIEAGIIEHQESLFEYGADNVKISEIMDRIRDEFSADVSFSEAMENCSVNGIISLISKCRARKDVKSSNRNFLENMVYTLQVGRDAMEERLAVIVSDKEEIKEALEDFCKDKENKNIYRGSLKQALRDDEAIVDGQEGREYINSLLLARKLSKIATLWVKGAEIDWSVLYGANASLTRISIPTYPFIRKRYWIGSYNTKKTATRKILDKLLPEKNNGYRDKKVETRIVPDWEKMAEGYNGDEVILEIVNDNIALLRMQDRKYRNGFSDQIITGLIAAFSKIKHNSSIKVVVLTGYDNIFSMGGTKDQLNDIAEQKSRFTDAPFLYRGLLETDIPVITAMQGHASGGGMLFGLYGDIVLMAEEGVYSAVFTKYGFTPGMGATYILKERFGGNLASEMMFTAKSFTGGELKERGVSVIIKRSEELLHEALKVAEMLSEKPLQTLKVLKKELAGRHLEKLQEFIEREEQMHSITFTQPEVKERIEYYYLDSKNKNRTKVERNQTEETGHKDKKLKVILTKTDVAEEKRELEIKKNLSRETNPLSEYHESSYVKRAEDYKFADGLDLKEEQVKKKISNIVGNILHIPENELMPTAVFKDLGADSISGVEIIRDINLCYNLNLDAVTMYDYPSIELLAAFVIEICSKDFGNVMNLVQKDLDVLQGKNDVAPVEKIPENLSCSDRLVRETQPSAKKEADKAEIEEKLKCIIGNILHMPEYEVDIYTSFKEMGVDSISGVEIIRDINKSFNLNLDAVVIYDYPNIIEMTEHIRTKYTVLSVSDTKQAVLEESAYEEVATVDEKCTAVDTDLKSSFFFKSSATYGRDISSTETIISTSEDKSQDANSIKLKHKSSEISFGSRKPLQLKNIQNNETYGSNVSTRNISPAEQAKTHEIVPVSIEKQKEKDAVPGKQGISSDIAIVGISGRFPGAENVHRYWHNLKNGVESISEVPKEKWNVDEYYDPDPRTPNKTHSRVGGFLKDTDVFDPLFFNISPLEAEAMDPQQRVFLEEAWRALEDAGYADRTLSNVKCGVFVGAAQGDYVSKLSFSRAENTAEAFAGMSSSILAARISYILNLKGPSIAIDTACSSSLVAIHQACLSIMCGETDMALAGGVRLIFTPSLYIQTSKMGMLSPTGKCRAFDNKADGTIMSEGAGVVVLKPLDKAIKDRDYIYGVIKGSGTNQDGKTNGITAPSAQSQTQLELDVYRRYGINPEDITYIEAHGTGTKLGDPIEIKALKDAFGEFTDKKQFCAIGSSKTNIGHATMAAGVAGVIKVLLSMKYKQIPPLLNFEKENEHIKFNETPFYVNTKLTDWMPLDGKSRMAAISAFGFSGTNCHIVIEEYTK